MSSPSSPPPLPPPAQRVYEQPVDKVIAYFVLQFVSFATLSILLATFVTGRVRRDKTIWTLVAVFMVTNWTSSLVLLSGTLMGKNGRETSFPLCLANASFIMGGTTAMSQAALNVVLKMFFLIASAKGRFAKFAESKAFNAYLLISPWALWLVMIIAAAVIGAQKPETVYKAVFYCAIDNGSFSSATMTISAITEVLTVIFTITIGVILFLHHRSLRKLLFRTPDTFTAQTESVSPSHTSAGLGGVSVNLVVRIALFQVCVIGALAVAIGTIDDFASITGDFAVTAIGPLVFVIFSSQADVLRAWHLLPASSPKHLASNPNTTLGSTFSQNNTHSHQQITSTPSNSDRGRKASSASTTSTQAKTPSGGGAEPQGQSFALDTLGYGHERTTDVENNGLGLRPQSSYTEGGRSSTPSSHNASQDDFRVGETRGGEAGESQVALRTPPPFQASLPDHERGQRGGR